MSQSQKEGSLPPIIAIVGPTAVGKSALALELARQLDACIVSADSRQVYRYMDIGTDKPSLQIQAEVRHYMIDVADPSDAYSVQRYTREGHRVLRRLAHEGRPALVVGGTGFYIRGLLDRVQLPEVEPNSELRAHLRHEAKVHGPQVLHARLTELDEASARRIHPMNTPRLIRALEIVQAIGGPVPPSTSAGPLPALMIGLWLERDELRARADRRIEQQISAGLAEEAALLLQMGYSPDLPSLDGFGYRQMIAYTRGEVNLETAVAEYKVATHKYIRRQLTWFRADERIHWLSAAKDPPQRALSLIEPWLQAV